MIRIDSLLVLDAVMIYEIDSVIKDIHKNSIIFSNGIFPTVNLITEFVLDNIYKRYYEL